MKLIYTIVFSILLLIYAGFKIYLLYRLKKVKKAISDDLSKINNACDTFWDEVDQFTSELSKLKEK
jgi:hypothetical protein